MKRLTPLFLIAAVMVTGVAAYAHHSTAMFDMRNPITLTGTIKSFVWVNPHCFINIEVAGADGKSEVWEVETHSISLLSRKGWTRSSFKFGETITVTGGRMKNGAKMIRLLRGVTASDGWKFFGDDFGESKPRGTK
jgi:hypothetical protein